MDSDVVGAGAGSVFVGVGAGGSLGDSVAADGRVAGSAAFWAGGWAFLAALILAALAGAFLVTLAGFTVAP